MPSPFPGMDPYLEHPDEWPDIHAEFIVGLRQRLNAALPTHYIARVDRHVWLIEPDAESRGLVGRPDVLVAERDGSRTGTAATAAAVVTAPLVGSLAGVVRIEGPRRVRILDRRGRQVVTVIELLSPANKYPGPDRNRYLAKRLDYLAGGTNLVEIDLLRAGPRVPVGRDVATAYCAAVVRPTRLPETQVWPIALRDPLPVIPIPLGPDEVEVPLQLQPLLDATYDLGRYADDLAYDQPPPAPPLTAADAAWVRERLAARPAEGR